MKEPIIHLDTEKKLRIFMLPLRQKILRLLDVNGTPMTAKQVADQLGIAPSSAKHHLGKLEEISLVVLDHQEKIHGITAHFYKTTGYEVHLGQQKRSTISKEKTILGKNLLTEAYHEYETLMERQQTLESSNFIGDLVHGVAHLTDGQAEELREMILSFFKENKTSSDKTSPWHISLLAYRADRIPSQE